MIRDHYNKYRTTNCRWYRCFAIYCYYSFCGSISRVFSCRSDVDMSVNRSRRKRRLLQQNKRQTSARCVRRLPCGQREYWRVTSAWIAAMAGRFRKSTHSLAISSR